MSAAGGRERRAERGASTYLGADRSGTEFWLSGPHVLSVAPGNSHPRRVCAIARFNRRNRLRYSGSGRCADGGEALAASSVRRFHP